MVTEEPLAIGVRYCVVVFGSLGPLPSTFCCASKASLDRGLAVFALVAVLEEPVSDCGAGAGTFVAGGEEATDRLEGDGERAFSGDAGRALGVSVPEPPLLSNSSSLRAAASASATAMDACVSTELRTVESRGGRGGRFLKSCEMKEGAAVDETTSETEDGRR